MLMYTNLIRDPRAPLHVPSHVLAALPPYLRIVEREQKREELKAGTYKVRGTTIKVMVRETYYRNQ